MWMVLSLLLLAALPVSPPVSEEALTLQALSAEGFSVTLPDGTSVPLAGLFGSGRPVVIEFWATWCAPCRKTVPHLMRLQERYRAQGLVVLGLSVEDPAGDAEAVSRFAEQMGVGYTLAFAPRGLYRRMTGQDDVSVPKVFVFAPDGRLVERVTSYTPMTNRRIASAVKKIVP